MKRVLSIILLTCGIAVTIPALSQVATTKEQMLFYTPEWKGERFADGRPKVSDSLMQRALGVSIEDVWDYLQGQGYHCQFDGEWRALHIDKPFSGRALTAQYALAAGHGQSYSGRRQIRKTTG
jgi:4-hydroxy-4-methyl-2-oxoglutarate aldolase